MLLAAFICFLIIAFTIKFGKKCVRELFSVVFHIKAGGGESFVFRFIDSESRDLAKKPAGEPTGRFLRIRKGVW